MHFLLKLFKLKKKKPTKLKENELESIYYIFACIKPYNNCNYEALSLNKNRTRTSTPNDPLFYLIFFSFLFGKKVEKMIPLSWVQ